MEVTDVIFEAVSKRALPFVSASLRSLALDTQVAIFMRTLKQYCGEAHVLKNSILMSYPEPEPPQIPDLPNCER